eukprot:2793401-Amphidinium_carterae.1
MGALRHPFAIDILGFQNSSKEEQAPHERAMLQLLTSTYTETACSTEYDDIVPSQGATADYLYPQGRGHPHHFGQSPHRFGGSECNLSRMLSWKWRDPRGRWAAITTGKPVVDHNYGIYVAQEDAIRKLSPNGSLLWTWQPEGYSYPGRHIPNHPALYDGLLYDCLSDGHVFALDMETGAPVWETRVSAAIGNDASFVTAYAGRIFLDVDAEAGRHVVALNSTTGSLLWEYAPDTGVWNFLPHFPGDDTLIVMGWLGDAHRVNMTTGRELWRAGHTSAYFGWTDGGPALGSNGVVYTVSSTATHDIMNCSKSTGGGIHAFRLDGKLLWERHDLEQGIYTYPVAGRLDPKSEEMAVVTGV